jgi:L-rhamnose mutarotase
VKRVARTAKLKPDAVEEYDRLHAGVWPEVLAAIERAGIRSYSIFRDGRRLFSYFETADDVDLAEATRLMLAEPKCRRWEELMQSLQERPAQSCESTWWTPMKEVFHQP